MSDSRAQEVPTPAFELSYNGKSITADIARHALSVSYTDHLSGESDELDVELEDVDGRWLDGWYPDKGATLALKLGYRGAALVAAGQGVVLLPRVVAKALERPGVVRLPLRSPGDLRLDIAFIWRRGAYLSRAAQAWLALVNEWPVLDSKE